MIDVAKKRWEEDPAPYNGWSRVAGDFDRLKHAAIALNRRIRESALLGPNYEIGHTYFFDVVHFLRQELASAKGGHKNLLWDRSGPMPPLDRLWKLSLRPLLQEYLAGLEASSRESELSQLQDVFLNHTADEE